MVLMFLGVVFLLVGFQAMNSDGDSGESSTISSAITTTPSASPSAEPAKAEVRVYNVGDTEGAGSSVADQLRQAGWNVTVTESLDLADVTATTVFFGDTPGEREAADEVGRILQAPVAPRVSGLADQPPGVVVAVTG